MYETYFEKVEKVLELFPLDCRKNYYNNKQTLEIKKTSPKYEYGSYDHYNNIIEFSKECALTHELFHMAFRDKEKIQKKAHELLIYENGIACKSIKTQDIVGRGLTEGFTEYLSRKCFKENEKCIKGHAFLYFFADLLISIYGEEILRYPLKNDPIGFITDERFFKIGNISINMDSLLDYQLAMHYISVNINLVKKLSEENTEFSKKLIKLKEEFKEYILKLLKQFIDEYKHCNNPLTSKKEFTSKMQKLITSKDYILISVLEYEDKSILEEVQKIIEEFNNTKIMTK